LEVEGIGVNVILTEVCVIEVIIGGLTGASGKSAAMTMIELVNKLSPIVLKADT
jgi:tRNA G37 N-methylase TrmD